MPLTIAVGLSRKASENFQSTGTSINITAELDQSLLARPDQLQLEVDSLYELASSAIDRQTAKLQAEADKPDRTGPGVSASGTQCGNGHCNGNGHTNGNGQTVAPMTQAQGRAIVAIARRLNIDAASECRNILGCDLAKLSVRQASEFIDHIKGLQPAVNEGP